MSGVFTDTFFSFFFYIWSLKRQSQNIPAIRPFVCVAPRRIISTCSPWRACVRTKRGEQCPRSQFNGLKFLQESSKKITHLFSEHMPRLTQIARSTVLRMQICFAWKSIWSCSKESRTALLLSPLTPARAGPPSRRLSPLAWKSFSPAPHARTQQSVAPPPRLASAGSKHHGPICRSHRPTLAGPCLRAGQGALQLFAQLDNTCNTGTQRE